MANFKISQLTGATTPLAGTEVVPVVQSSTTKQVSVANLTAGRAVAASSVTLGGGSNSGPMTVNGSIASVYIDSTGIQQVFTRAATNYISAPNGGFEYDGSVHTFKNQDQTVTFLTVASDTTFNSGNLIQGTAAKGINFTANTPAAGMTSRLLNWYEEGTFTPTWTPATGSGQTVNTALGWYQRVGKRVFFDITLSTNGHGTAAGNITIGGLPFTSSANVNQYGGAYCVEAANAGFAGAYTPALRVDFNATTITPIIFSATTGSATMTAANWGVSGFYRFVGSYQVA